MNVTIVILTIPRNLEQAKQVRRHLLNHQFPSAEIRICPSAPKGASKHDIHISCYRNHYNILRQYIKKHHSSSDHIIVVEDDCEFISKKPTWPTIKRHLEYLDKEYPNWATFHIGHCPLGPLFGTSHSEIVRTLLPFTTHCYAMNAPQIITLFKNHPNFDDWTRLYALEGWLWIPWKQKFAMFPGIATQNRMPKEVKNSKIVQKVGLSRCLGIVEQTMMYSVSGICLIVLVVLMVRLLLRKSSS